MGADGGANIYDAKRVYLYIFHSEKRNCWAYTMVFHSIIWRLTIRRILIPYSMMFIAEVILQSLTKSAKMNSIFAFLTGGWGPGAYYIPLLFQLLLIFPILYRTYQRNAMEGFCKVFALSVAVEYIFSVMSLSDLLYSRCISRYIVMIYLRNCIIPKRYNNS